MTFKLYIPLIALMLAAPLPASAQDAEAAPAQASTTRGTASDFQLPPAPSASETPRVQGPVDTDGPVPVTPRVIPTARPTPRSIPTSTPPIVTRPAPQTTLTPRTGDRVLETRRFTPAARSAPGAQSPADQAFQSGPAPAPPIDLPSSEAPQTGAPLGTLPSIPASPPPGVSTPNLQSPTGGLNWPLWAALAAALAAVAGAFVYLRSRGDAATAGAPQIEPPLIRREGPPPTPTAAKLSPAPPPLAQPKPAPTEPAQPKTAPAAAPAPATTPLPVPTLGRSPLDIVLTTNQLSRSIMNVTLGCTIMLENRLEQELRNIVVSGDLVTAHGRVPINDQMAAPETQLPPIQTLASLVPGESNEVSASFALPVNQVRPMQQGRAFLFVPLLRLRIMADGIDPVTRTYVVGNSASKGAGKVQPFRLDELPQTYRQIGARPLD